MLDRRDILKGIGTLSLMTIAAQTKAFGLNFGSEGAEWANDMRRLSDELVAKRITPEAWQVGVNKIYSQTKFASLLRSLDFEAVSNGMEVKDDAGTWLSVFIKGLSQQGQRKNIHTKVVGLKKGRTVPPHGHENEVSAFLTLSGEFHLRQWHRLAVHSDSLDISPAFAGKSKPGEWSTQSEEKSNIHWLTTETEEAFFLSIRVAKLDGTDEGRDRIPIDPEGAKDLGNGIFRAPIMAKDAWWDKYSKSHG